MKLVVGLGNPGRKYADTRHNVGFAVLDLLARRYGEGNRRNQFQGETVEAMLGSQRALLLWPQTYMNLSGASVLAARDFYKMPLTDLLVVCDDFNLPLGKLRLRPAGSSGGQRGLENILLRLAADDVARMRLGVGAPEGDSVRHVLGKFRKEEVTEIEIAIQHAADAVFCWANKPIQDCMSQYN